ncbi:SDR family NAD(P)-dependent oxidoreductase [Candidatus Sumerlaeota bacterium]|nr:SDR family NAD(P)-dependent oxidoreductase [Candidatus Sumerlaeales bacterium]NLD61561.1 SDR family NAD(P)-dependent oxidoreductase [Candidatus Sumerlaeota bacterium]
MMTNDTFWQNRKVLVTGAGGFIGSHLTEQLVELGADVTAFIRYNANGCRGLLSTLPCETLNKIRFVNGDLCHAGALDEAFEGQQTVFHLAAIIAIPYSYKNPQHVVTNNVTATLNVLEAAKRHKVKRIVNTSSSEVYGTAQRVPIDESHPLQAQSPYAAAKIATDKLAQAWNLSYDLPVVTLRPFNTYGPRQSARAIVPTIITQAITLKKIFLGAVHPTRDLNFVTDTVQGFLKIAQTPGIEGQTFNVGSGIEISIGDLADQIIKILGNDIPIIFDASRIRPTPSEVNRLLADASQATKVLGWKPQVNLPEGLSRTIDYINQHIGEYRPTEYSI